MGSPAEKSEEESISENSSVIAASWSSSEEKLLKSIAERSNCMRWLHTQCNLHFDNLNFYFTIPNIILSTLNGSFTMSLSALLPDPNSQRIATFVIGLVSIFSAVLITLNQYMKSQEMTEAHRAAAVAYSKLSRIIMNELSLRREQRTNGLEFLKYVRAEVDRLENTAPAIIHDIIYRFNLTFADKNIEKPEITGDLDEVEINKISRKRRNSLTLFKSIRGAFTKSKVLPSFIFERNSPHAENKNTIVKINESPIIEIEKPKHT
jgi:hypothetical protein